MCSSETKVKEADQTHVHTWIFEPDGGELTSEGIENIATHKYVGGEYTHIDNFLNPTWTYLTNLLPMWVAPNLVTTIGGMHTLSAYFLLMYFSPSMNENVPSWTLIYSSYCIAAYYTFDCMDGKQSRRTNTSSPLGQLFDHGFDCICSMLQVSVAVTYLQIGDTYYHYCLQGIFQWAFFCAQWEEYYTHVLPHGVGKWFGVTECNYALALIAFTNGIIDREAFWGQTLHDKIPLLSGYFPHFASLELRHSIPLMCCAAIAVQIPLSMKRVWSHLDKFSTKVSAISKHLSPLLITATPFILPYHLIQNEAREVSLAMGLLLCLITVKMVVFSMAKMSYASIQLDVVPYFLFIICLHFIERRQIQKTSLVLFCLWHTFRLLLWSRHAILTLTERLDIYCFSIKKKKSV